MQSIQASVIQPYPTYIQIPKHSKLWRLQSMVGTHILRCYPAFPALEHYPFAPYLLQFTVSFQKWGDYRGWFFDALEDGVDKQWCLISEWSFHKWSCHDSWSIHDIIIVIILHDLTSQGTQKILKSTKDIHVRSDISRLLGASVTRSYLHYCLESREQAVQLISAGMKQDGEQKTCGSRGYHSYIFIHSKWCIFVATLAACSIIT